MTTTEQEPVAERLLTPAEVAGMLRVDPRTVSRWHRKGRIAGFRTPGGQRRFRESDVRALMTVSDSNA
jgi:excisionase family DNA binding protein